MSFQIRRAIVAWGAISLCASFAALGQDAANEPLLPSAPTRIITVAEALKDRGINRAPASLTAALRNSDPYVRSLAANMLAQDRDLEEVPQIEAALTVETDPQARIGISGALSSLHDPKGAESLWAMCTDPKLPIRFVIESASHLQLLRLPSGICADTIIDSLIIESDASYRDYALNSLPPMYKEVSPSQQARILAAVEGLLKDPAQQTNVRLAAGHALTQIGSLSSVDAFNAAILREKDANMKRWLQDDLNALRRSSK